MDKTYTHTVTADADIKVKFQSLFVEGGASLILSPDKLAIQVKVTTADSTPVTVEGCTETTLTSGAKTVLHAKGRRVILKGKITELYCDRNQLTALNVQGLTALQELYCDSNQLTALDVQGLTALQRLWCYNNQLTELNVQGLTALRALWCGVNRLTELNVQGCTALQELYCDRNQLTALDVQGLTALQRLGCWSNQLNADTFKKLFDDLPVRQDSYKGECILYTEESGVTESNHTDFTAPQDLKDAFDNAKTVKKWKMYKWNGSWPGVEI
ncbi:leucine-rich repeat domain-containing protein [uncultured Treponema sp.]|uniref:leucine-rich repeat domain-containing protein n=1 Tax=uncultured Treponema sp. TaxID=162155 RepID=UPI0028EB6267|nr:leucine-rich repeat domain-containing protein [uncultured Treponema sp.]